MSKTVAVVEAYGQAVQNVFAHAEQAFERNTATYRRLVAAMAESGGTLPQADADALVAVCEALGINPERLGDDAAAVMNANDLTAKIEETQQRNVARRAPLPGLQAEWDAARAVWIEVSSECQERMRVAQADVMEKQRAYEKLAQTRDESTEHHERDLIRLRDAHPHVFGPVTRERLAWAVGDKRSRFAL